MAVKSSAADRSDAQQRGFPRPSRGGTSCEEGLSRPPAPGTRRAASWRNRHSVTWAGPDRPLATAVPGTEPVRRGHVARPQPALLFNFLLTFRDLKEKIDKIQTLGHKRSVRRRQQLSPLRRSSGWLHPQQELLQNKYFFQDVAWKETVRKLSPCVNNTVSGGEESVIRNSCSSELSNSVIL